MQRMLWRFLTLSFLACGGVPNTPTESTTPQAMNTVEFSELDPELGAVLSNAATLELFILHPEKDDESERPTLYGYEIQSTRTASGPVVMSLIEALAHGDRENDERIGLCFNPRHGVRARGYGKVVELVICFECASVEIFVNGEPAGLFLTSASPADTFNQVYANLGP